MKVRKFNKEDLLMMNEWAKFYNDLPFPPGHVPAESTFVAYENGEPQMVCSVILTNTDFAWLENLVGNPNGNRSKDLLSKFVDYMNEFAKNEGKKMFFGMSKHPKTTELYKRIGFTNTLNNVDTFAKEIK